MDELYAYYLAASFAGLGRKGYRQLKTVAGKLKEMGDYFGHVQQGEISIQCCTKQDTVTFLKSNFSRARGYAG